MENLSMEKSRCTTVKKRNVFQELYHSKVYLFMMLPGLTALLVFNYLPLPGILISFKNFKYYGNIFQSFTKSKWVGLKNFEFLFKSPDAFTITRNTVLYNAVFIILGLFVAVTLSIMLNELLNRRLAKVYQTTYLLPYFLSWVIVSYIVFSLLNMDRGILNKGILEPLGLSSVQWYNEKVYWPFFLTVINIWKYAGYSSVIYLAAIVGTDEQYYDAAAIDGATKWQQTKYITIPMLTTLITILSILAVGRIFQSDFGLFYNVPLSSGPLFPVTQVIDTYVFRTMKNGQYDMAAAGGFYQAIVGFVLVIVTNRIVGKINKENTLF